MTVIAIDGPAGAGKSTVARAVARRLGWTYLDTGAMYRVVALAAREAGADLADPDELGRLAQMLDIRVVGTKAFLGERDVTAAIRSPDVDAIVSTVAAHPVVRNALVTHQRRLASIADVVMEGRDIGTTVMPDAAVKIFLTASAAERARRRARQMGVALEAAALAEVESDLQRRDRDDSSRAESPLRPAPDAIVMDTTGMSLDEVVAAIVGIASGAGSP